MSSESQSSVPLACEAAENCDYPIDIVLQSNDGRRFGAHTTQLSLYTESFPRSDQGSITSTPGETVVLTESPEVLLLMLQFMHNQTHPDLESLDLDLLLAFAIAADKYGMYPALQACRRVINSRGKERPAEILCLKFRHHWNENIDEIARFTLDMDPKAVSDVLVSEPQALAIWVRYKLEWVSKLANYHKLVNSVVDIPFGRMFVDPEEGSRDFEPKLIPESCKWTQLKQTLFHVMRAMEKPPSVEELDRTVRTFEGMDTLKCNDECYGWNDSEYHDVHRTAHWEISVREAIMAFPKWEEFL